MCRRAAFTAFLAQWSREDHDHPDAVGVDPPQRRRCGASLDVRGTQTACSVAQGQRAGGNPSLYPHLTGRENLEITCRLLNLPSGAVERALGLVNLSPAGNKLVRGYSLGMRQRLALAACPNPPC